MRKTHYLKIFAPFFKQVKSRTKRFEIRYDDRGIEVGDFLMLQEQNEDGSFTGESILVEVSIKFSNEKFGLKKGYAIFGIKFYEECDDDTQGAMQGVCKSPIS